MNSFNTDRFCPCCGYPGLTTVPYKDYTGPPVSEEMRPPYYYFMGEPSYEVCSCCGYEFGNDDEPGTSEPTSFEEYLLQWIKNGCTWFAPNSKPDKWSLSEQLRAAGITNPVA